MDSKTLDAYSKLAEEYSQDWLSQPEPTDMYQLLEKYFIKNGTTADIGCGNGRDANWMSKNGFKVLGFDSSAELIALATKNFPEVPFQRGFLPKLSEIQTQFDNVLCETVIMHLSQDQISEAITNLKRIVKKDGRIYLSWRVTENTDARHQDGRLYSAFGSDFVLKEFPKSSVLHFEDVKSLSSGKRICRLICKL